MRNPYDDFDDDFPIEFYGYDEDDDWDDYDEDSYVDPDWAYEEPEEEVQHTYIHKAANGQLSIENLTLYRYEDQEWSEAHCMTYRLNVGKMVPKLRDYAIQLGKTMKPNTTAEIYFPPLSDDEIPF